MADLKEVLAGVPLPEPAGRVHSGCRFFAHQWPKEPWPVDLVTVAQARAHGEACARAAINALGDSGGFQRMERWASLLKEEGNSLGDTLLAYCEEWRSDLGDCPSGTALSGRKLPAIAVANDTMTAEEARDSQRWAGMDGAIAWHLIDRHANGWADVGKMMEAWLEANIAARAAKEA
jgi:hypothetical protein